MAVVIVSLSVSVFTYRFTCVAMVLSCVDDNVDVMTMIVE